MNAYFLFFSLFFFLIINSVWIWYLKKLYDERKIENNNEAVFLSWLNSYSQPPEELIDNRVDWFGYMVRQNNADIEVVQQEWYIVYDHNRGIVYVSTREILFESEEVIGGMKPDFRWLNSEIKTLSTKISEHFSLAEIRQLAFRLDVEYESLTGSTKPEIALSLVECMKHRGLLGDLINACEEERPHVDINWRPFVIYPSQSINEEPIFRGIMFKRGDKVVVQNPEDIGALDQVYLDLSIYFPDYYLGLYVQGWNHDGIRTGLQILSLKQLSLEDVVEIAKQNIDHLPETGITRLCA